MTALIRPGKCPHHRHHRLDIIFIPPIAIKRIRNNIRPINGGSVIYPEHYDGGNINKQCGVAEISEMVLKRGQCAK